MNTVQKKFIKNHQIDLYVAILVVLFLAIMAVFLNYHTGLFANMPTRVNAQESNFTDYSEPIIMKVKA
jgi:hypothetical protein